MLVLCQSDGDACYILAAVDIICRILHSEKGDVECNTLPLGEFQDEIAVDVGDGAHAAVFSKLDGSGRNRVAVLVNDLSAHHNDIPVSRRALSLCSLDGDIVSVDGICHGQTGKRLFQCFVNTAGAYLAIDTERCQIFVRKDDFL